MKNQSKLDPARLVVLHDDFRAKSLQLHTIYQAGLRELAWNAGKRLPDQAVREYQVLPNGDIYHDLKD